MKEEKYDYLTGLYTRKELHSLYESMPTGSICNFMFMDIDNFKNVNDVYGHNAGDLLLKATAIILNNCAPDAHIFRLGGDEFVLLFQGEHAREYLCAVAKEIIYQMTKKEGFSHISTSVSASIGILYHETSTSTLDDILLKSDMAMYYAKSHGKGNYVVFNDIANQVFSEIEMQKRQAIALENGEFEIRYLPVISAQTSKLRLSQIKLYWNMPNGITKEQDDFLPLFEKNGFMRQLSMWLLQNALEHLQKYHTTTGLKGKIGLRISRLQLLDSEFPQTIASLAKSSNVAPSELNLEVDERSFDRGSDTMLVSMKKLKKMGFEISIIGVGSTFKSLIYWDKLQFDYIIFAPEYLHNALASARGRQIIKTLLAMGRELKMSVIAEGISTKEDAQFLSGCGCNAISGSYYSVPLPTSSYFEYAKDKIVQSDEKVEFPFLGNLSSADGKYTGHMIGQNIKFAKGISSKWGALLFPGGSLGENVVELPAAILAESSYTICMWLKPLKSTSWTSSFYARYQGSFCSFSPYVVGGNSIFRISEDTDINGFHDALARQIPQDVWTFVCITYDNLSEISKTYINGRKAGFRTDAPSLIACRQILLGGDPFQPSYEGYISGIVFYEDVKAEEEIREIYQHFCEEPNFCGSMEDFWMELSSY